MTTKSACRKWLVFAAVWGLAPAIAGAARFQFEVLGTSDDWIVMRENIPARAADTAACRYPGLDPSEHVGVRVYFMRVSAAAKRRQLAPFDSQSSSTTPYSPARHGEGCTSAADSDGRWREIASRADSLGIYLSSSPTAAVVLGGSRPGRSLCFDRRTWVG